MLEDAKTDRSRRTIVLPEPAVEVLTSHRFGQVVRPIRSGPLGDLVFTTHGHPLWAGEVTRQFRLTQVWAGLRSVRFHDLRHAAATLMLASGTDLKVVSEVLGHSTVATTADIYAGVLTR